MNDVKIFNHDEFGEIRTTEENGKVLFCGTDVAKALGYANAPDAIRKHCKKDGIAKCDSVDSLGRKNTLSFITEGNVYRLITHSKLESAERFESWVFDEVLPTIRKTGCYCSQKMIDCRTFEKVEKKVENLGKAQKKTQKRVRNLEKRIEHLEKIPKTEKSRKRYNSMLEKYVSLDKLRNKDTFMAVLPEICKLVCMSTDITKKSICLTELMDVARMHDRNLVKGEEPLADYVYSTFQQYNSEFNHDGEIWELPKDFSSRIKPPEFPVEALPPVLQDMLRATAEYIQVDVNMCALPLLSVLSLCLEGKAMVQSPGNGFLQNLNLYTLTVAESGERKSAVFSEFMQPVQDYCKRYDERRKLDIANYKTQHEMLCSERQKAIKKNDKTRAEQLDKEIISLEANPVRPMRMVVTDITPEALVNTMNYYGECMGILSDEAGILQIIGGMYSKNNNPNIDIFLNAYDGKETFVSRITREDAHLKNPLLTIGLMAQPNIFNSFMCNRNFRERGLNARFLYSFTESMAGYQKFFSTPIPETTKNKYNALICRLLDIPRNKAIPVIQCDGEATRILEDYYSSVQKNMRRNGLLENEKEWASKQYARVLRIAAVLHLCEYESADRISGNTALRAVNIGIWTEGQVIHMNKIVESENIRNAKYLLCRLKQITADFKGKQTTLTLTKGNLLKIQELKANEIQEPLDILESMNCLRVTEEKTGGRPKVEILINMLICTEFCPR